MYTVYLYDNIGHNRDKNNFGFWDGRFHTVHGRKFPVICSGVSVPKKYTSIGRAVTGAEKVLEKTSIIIGYDIEDENHIVVYHS